MLLYNLKNNYYFQNLLQILDVYVFTKLLQKIQVKYFTVGDKVNGSCAFGKISVIK
jgi:hypothetical protein